MQIECRFFASVREQLGVSQETLQLPADVRTVAQARSWLQARGTVWASALADGRAIRTAYNQQMCPPEQLLTEGGELAFFPPVTGG